jgi:4-amino-4-deoxy-L-arabinose transferase-like glycosyltransferase
MPPELQALNTGATYRLLGWSVILAIVVRLYLLWHYCCISSDGVRYIDAARDFFAGNISAGLSSVHPPAYPLFIAALYPLVGDWELSGQIGSLLAGALLLFPLYVLCQRIYGENVAVVACLLAAISPYLARYSVDVRTESLFLLLSTAALVLFHQGIERSLRDRLFYGGLVAGLAYLVRPEAVGFLIIVPVTLAVRCWVNRDRRILWFFTACLLLLLGFLLFALPYIYYLSLDTGYWGAFSRKAAGTLRVGMGESGLLDAVGPQSIPDLRSMTFVQFLTKHPFLYMKKVALDLGPSVGVYFEALHYSYAPFFLLGLIPLIRKRFWGREDLLLLTFVLFYLLGFALIYVNRRFALQMVPVSLGWTAVGLLWSWAYLKKSLSRKVFQVAFSVMAAIFLAGTLGKTLKPFSSEKAYVREAGWYLKRLRPSGDLRLLVFDRRIAFYAESKPIFLDKLQEPNLLQHLREGKADYLATEARLWQERYPSIAQDPGLHGLVLQREFRISGKDKLMIFKVTGKTNGGTA